MVSVAADIVGGVPETASLITGMLAQIAAGTARETIFHCGARTFLQRVNQDLFMPRGLCVMVMALKDNVLGPQHGPLGPLSQKLGEPIFAMEEIEFGQPRVNNRLAGGNREVQTGLPQAAPLVYPDLDLPMTQAINNKRSRRERVSPGSCGACQGLKVAGVWVQDYVEKKAQVSIPSITSIGRTFVDKPRNPITNRLRPVERESLVSRIDSAVAIQVTRRKTES